VRRQRSGSRNITKDLADRLLDMALETKFVQPLIIDKTDAAGTRDRSQSKVAADARSDNSIECYCLVIGNN
jgi:hypothetical protein